MIISNHLGTDVERIPFRLATAAGMMKKQVSRANKFGMQPNVVSGTTEIWPLGSLRVLPTTATVITATSSSAQDTMTTGTGAWTVYVEGLDTNYLNIAEEFELNGTLGATSAKEFFRINRAFVRQSGANRENAGNITLTVDGNPQAYIEATEGQTHQTHFTMPANTYGIIEEISFGVGRMAGTSDAHILTQVRRDGVLANAAWRTFMDIYLFNGQSVNMEDFFIVPEKSEFRQRVVSTTTSQAWSIVKGYFVKGDGIELNDAFIL